MPGASEDFTVLLTVRPFSTAFFASKPAASITDWIARVRAARDGRDEHGAVANVAFELRRFAVHRVGGRMFVEHLALAAPDFSIFLAAAARMNFAARGNMNLADNSSGSCRNRFR